MDTETEYSKSAADNTRIRREWSQTTGEKVDTTADHALALRQNAIKAGQYWRASNGEPRVVHVAFVYGNKVIVRGNSGRGAHEEYTRSQFDAAFFQAVICRGSSCSCGHYYTHHTIGTSMCTAGACECMKFALVD